MVVKGNQDSKADGFRTNKKPQLGSLNDTSAKNMLYDLDPKNQLASEWFVELAQM